MLRPMRVPGASLMAVGVCVLASALPVSAALPAAAPPPNPCTAAEYHQFDFWVGTWRVTQGNVFAGSNHIERAFAGCVLIEHWQGTGGAQGSSFNTYLPARHVWHQSWVDNQGTLLLLEGTLRNGSMVLEGDQAGSPGQAGTRERITWTPREDGAVRQHWESSADQGGTWKTVFDGLYRPQK